MQVSERRMTASKAAEELASPSYRRNICRGIMDFAGLHAPVDTVRNGEQCQRNEGAQSNSTLGPELHSPTVAPYRYRRVRERLPLRIDVNCVPIQPDSQPSTVLVPSSGLFHDFS